MVYKVSTADCKSAEGGSIPPGERADSVAEWLLRLVASEVGYAHTGSNPVAVGPATAVNYDHLPRWCNGSIPVCPTGGSGSIPGRGERGD